MLGVNAGRGGDTRNRPAHPFVGAAASRSLADLRSDHRLAGISTVASWTFPLTSSGLTAPSTTVTTAGWPSANWIAAWRRVILCFLQISSIAFTLSTTALGASV